jgi:DNA-binding XRE family transcriptional regulator
MTMTKKPGMMKPAELKEARVCLGFTQEQLAIELGVHRLSVIRWEAGMHRIPTMLALAIKQLDREHHPARDETGLLQTQVS